MFVEDNGGLICHQSNFFSALKVQRVSGIFGGNNKFFNFRFGDDCCIWFCFNCLCGVRLCMAAEKK